MEGGGGVMAGENTDTINLTPSPSGFFDMLWLIATSSENVGDREYARRTLKAGYIRGLESIPDDLEGSITEMTSGEPIEDMIPSEGE